MCSGPISVDPIRPLPNFMIDGSSGMLNSPEDPPSQHPALAKRPQEGANADLLESEAAGTARNIDYIIVCVVIVYYSKL